MVGRESNGACWMSFTGAHRVRGRVGEDAAGSRAGQRAARLRLLRGRYGVPCSWRHGPGGRARRRLRLRRRWGGGWQQWTPPLTVRPEWCAEFGGHAAGTAGRHQSWDPHDPGGEAERRVAHGGAGESSGQCGLSLYRTQVAGTHGQSRKFFPVAIPVQWMCSLLCIPL